VYTFCETLFLNADAAFPNCSSSALQISETNDRSPSFGMPPRFSISINKFFCFHNPSSDCEFVRLRFFDTEDETEPASVEDVRRLGGVLEPDDRLLMVEMRRKAAFDGVPEQENPAFVGLQ